ncbi:hypothetical protein J3R82DRAFT_6125 [Butyriboletus roseoflavus]|nr:hypothetical protein J3R82DRAFT_6125 [Butyriboletus roseoflavus]
MSLSVPVQDGIYQIFNVEYPTQVAELFDGSDSDVVGWQSGGSSLRMEWQVTNVLNTGVVGQVTFLNQDISTYAQIPEPPYPAPGTHVVGNPTSTVDWAVSVPANLGGSEQYVISLVNTPYVWTLADAYNGTSITLEETTAEPQPNQLWTFVQVN